MVYLRLGLLLTVVPVLLFSFQNCGGGFQVSQTGFIDPSSQSSNDTLALNNLQIMEPLSQSASQGQIMLKGICSSGVMIQVLGDVVSPMSVQCNSNQFAISVTFSAGDGMKNIRITQKDFLGNTKEDSRSFMKDTVAPVVDIMNLVDNAFINSSVMVSGVCESGLVVKLTIGSASQNTNCVSGMFSATLNLVTLADGNLSLEASQTDVSGLKGTKVKSLRKDTVAPNIVINSPANNAAVTSPITLSGACETGLNITITGAGVGTSLNASCVNSVFSLSVPLTSGTGAKAVMVTQVDAAGNSKSDSKTYQAQAPTTPTLAVMISSPAANSVAKNGVTLQGSCVSGVQVAISGAGVSANSSVACTSGAFSAAITFSAGDGAKVVQVSQVNGDASGSDTRSFMKDTTAPNLTISMPAANAAGKTGLTLTGACESGLAVTISGTGVSANSSATCSNGSYSSNVTFSNNDGTKAITVSQTDAATNVTSVSRNFVKDSVAPVVTIASPVAGASAATGLTLAGACESGLNVTASGTGVKANVSGACTNAAYSLTITFSDNDGVKAVEVAQTDAAGNIGKAQQNFQRTTAPVVYDGSQLYAQNCAACHGALANSVKKDRTAEQISSAITSIPNMTTLTFLTAPQIQAIAGVLKTNTNPVNACTTESTRGGSRTGVNRLTSFELDASVALVLPATKTKMGTTWTTLFRTYPENLELSDVKDFNPLYNATQLDAWLNIVDQIGAAVSTADIDSCLSVSAPAQTCYRTAITNWVKKVWRRPLTTTEIDDLTNQVSSMTKAAAITRLTTAALISPNFMFRIESSDSLVGTRVRVNAYSVASRISYAILGSGPDATLMSAADKNELQTLAQVETQVKRLLATTGAKSKFEVFVRSWLKFSKLSNSATDFPTVSGNLNPNDLKIEATTREVLEYVTQVVWNENGSLRDLMSRPIAVARSASLASIYGSTANTANTTTPTAYPAPNHPGLALRAAFLMSGSQYSSPIRRGVFVLQRLLCSDIPPPSAEVFAMRDAAAAGIDPLTMPNWETVQRATSGASCIACHSKINPIGFSFENFDAVGRSRTQQDVLNLTNGMVVASFPLPAASTIPIELELNISSASSGQQLSMALAESPKVQSCMNSQFFRHLERRMESSLDTCTMSESLNTIKQNQPLLEGLTRAIASEDIFWRGAN